MNRFIVAPGELILVSDGKGGVTRMSGTSFAAPLVAGAAALIQDRWPWLKEKPRDVAHILLKSAKDLGAPGVDAVYGVGLLDVEASQSPLDFSKLEYKVVNASGKSEGIKLDVLRSGGLQSSWATNDMHFTAIEKLPESDRDFLIPLSTRLYGTQRGGEYFQDFVYNRMNNWISGGRFAEAGPARLGFSDRGEGQPVALAGGWRMSMAGRLVNADPTVFGLGRTGMHSSVTVAAPGDAFSFGFGQGDGAAAIGSGPVSRMTADFDAYSGGTNPLLGFASGGAHLGARVAVAPGLSLSAGTTERRLTAFDTRMALTGADPALVAGLDRSSNRATNLRADWAPSADLQLGVGVTRLNEGQGFLGVRSLERTDLGRGATTTGATLDLDWSLSDWVALFGSATVARSRTPDPSAALRIADGGAIGTAFQAGAAVSGLVARGDRLRLSLSQPMTLESGRLQFTSLGVVDRQTGALGEVTSDLRLGDVGARRLVVDAMYGTSLFGGRGELGLFGRGELNPVDEGTPDVMAGAHLNVAF